MCCTTVARFLDLCSYILCSGYRFSEDSAECLTYPNVPPEGEFGPTENPLELGSRSMNVA